MESTKNIKEIETSMDVFTTISKGMSKDKAAKFEASQLKRQAIERRAKGSREAAEESRKGRILTSNVRAAQAAAGGVTTDVGAVEQLADVKRTSDYNSLSALFDAESQARNLELKAKVKRSEGKYSRVSANVKSLSTVLGSSKFESFLSKKNK